MNKIFTIAIIIIGLICLNTFLVQAQDTPIKPSKIITGKFLGETPPLRDLPPITEAERRKMERESKKEAREEMEKDFQPRYYPYSATALPKDGDPVWQKTMGKSATGGSKAPIINFDAQTTTSYPPDCNGTIGPNHYM